MVPVTSRAALVAATALCTVLGACGRPGDDRAPDVGDDRTVPVEDAGTEPGAGSDFIGSDPSPSTGATSPTSAGVEPGPSDAAPDPSPDSSPDTPSEPVGDATPNDTDVLAGQFTAFVGGIGDGLSCPDDEDPDPYVGRSTTSGDEVAVGGTVLLCLGGFDPALPVELVLAAAGADRDVTVLPAPRDDGGASPVGVDLWTTDAPVPSASFATDAWRSVQWWLASGTPVGEWSLTATQGSTTATSIVDVQVGSVARFVGAHSDGSSIRFHASGFPPGPTPVGLYRPTTPRSELGATDEVMVTFVEELGTLQADQVGAGVVDIDRAALEPGEWCISTAATPSLCRWLTIE